MSEQLDLRTPAGLARARELMPHLFPVGNAAEGGLDETVPAIGEKRWMWQVINHAEERGWRYFHCFNATMAPAGWPDLVLVRERIIFAELKKSPKDKPTAAQQSWLKALRDAKAEVYVWLPKHWPQVMEALK